MDHFLFDTENIKSDILNLFLLYFSLAPDAPPGNVTALSPDSSRIIVTWTPIPDDSVNGILQGYRVFYRSLLDDGNNYTVTVGPSTLKATINEDLNYTDIYEVRVAGFTNAGVGAMSDPVTVQPGKALGSF